MCTANSCSNRHLLRSSFIVKICVKCSNRTFTDKHDDPIPCIFITSVLVITSKWPHDLDIVVGRFIFSLFVLLSGFVHLLLFGVNYFCCYCLISKFSRSIDQMNPFMDSDHWAGAAVAVVAQDSMHWFYFGIASFQSLHSYNPTLRFNTALQTTRRYPTNNTIENERKLIVIHLFVVLTLLNAWLSKIFSRVNYKPFWW